MVRKAFRPHWIGAMRSDRFGEAPSLLPREDYELAFGSRDENDVV
jgi:hypothetical protein